MAVLVTAIHAVGRRARDCEGRAKPTAWMPGTSPGMTACGTAAFRMFAAQLLTYSDAEIAAAFEAGVSVKAGSRSVLAGLVPAIHAVR